MKKVLLPILACVLALTGCSANSHLFKLPLNPVPYSFKVDPSIVTHLSVRISTGNFAKAATKDGAKAQAIVYYTPTSGKEVIFMSVYLFPQAIFDRLKNPNQPPSYGQEVIRRNGEVLSIAGPSDSIFDPKSADGKNVTALYATIYKTSAYSPTP